MTICSKSRLVSLPRCRRKSFRAIATKQSATVLIIALSGLHLAVGMSARAQTVNTTFSYTGANQYFVVPTGVTSLEVRLWGAGGLGDGPYWGGGGAFVHGNLAVAAGESLTVLVGGGGNQSGAFGGGGAATSGFGGGGRSALILASAELVDAGGGGGATSTYAAGGGGGVTAGTSGSPANGYNGGGGGTQSSGGAGGSGGTDGAYLQGGGGEIGGGGGFYGGGGGLGGGGFGGGGGGGSSYISDPSFTLIQGLDAVGDTPGGYYDPLNNGAGLGLGYGGEIVISYSEPGSTPEPGSLALISGLGAAGLGVFARRMRRLDQRQ